MNPEYFIDYNSLFSQLYKTPSRGSVTRTHMFTAEKCDGMHVII